MEQDIMLEFRILENGSSFISKNAKEFGENKAKGFDPALVLIEYIPGKEETILY